MRLSSFYGSTMPAIPLEQVPELVEFLHRKIRTNRREAVACLLGLNGLRISEVVNLKRKDFRPCRAKVDTLKGGKKREIPCSKDLCEALTKLKRSATKRKTSYLFHTKSGRQLSVRNLRRTWAEWSLKALGKSWRFHDLRHTCARYVYRESENQIFAVAHVLGHRKIENTVIYLYNEDELKFLLPTSTREE